MSLRSWLKSFAKTTRETSHTYKPNTVHAAGTSISENEANRARDAGRAAYEAKDFATAIDCFSRVIQCAHDDAEAHNYLGLCYLERGEYEDASDSFTLASHFKPDFAQPFFNLASLEYKRGNLKQAIAHLEHAIELKPDFANAHNNLGFFLMHDLGDIERGAKHIEIALQLTPASSDVLCNYSMVLIHLGRSEDALQLCSQLLTFQPDMHDARLNRGLAALKLGRFAEGWADYEARKLARSNYESRSPAAEEWQGDALGDVKLLVYAEQGLGDQIMFASCLPQLLQETSGAVVECTPRLAPLFRRSFPTATIELQRPGDAALEDLARPHGFQRQVAIGSLPRFYRNSLSQFPMHDGYLHADPARVAYWRRRLETVGPGWKVGISWFGGAASTRRDSRSTRLEDWLPILNNPECRFVSLQYGKAESDLQSFAHRHPITIHAWKEAIEDYDETAALVTALDLVISVQTAVVHLAGALGTAVWAVLPAVAEWRYQEHGEQMPWYPSARLLRQAVAGDWTPVLCRAANELRAVSGKTARPGQAGA